MRFESRTRLWTVLFTAIFSATSIARAAGAAQCVCPEACTCDLQEGSIDCSNRSLRTIPATLNCAWPNITKINLKQNQITHVPGYALSRVANLERLYLYENLIETIDQNAFFNLTQLRYLFLDSNRLRSLPDEVFYPVRNLYSILLYTNQISYLPVNVFSTLSKLFRLALHDNALTILDARSFNGLINLEELYLSNNQILGLSNSPFTFLADLRQLHLSNNNLTRLTRFDFIGANRLTFLDLSSNKISLIDDDTFLLHTDIQILLLNNNLVSRVTRLTFTGILQLQFINLRNNRITHISDGSFFRNRQLQEILGASPSLLPERGSAPRLPHLSLAFCQKIYSRILSDNLLEVFNPNILAGLQSLQRLFVADNRLTFLQNKQFTHAPLLLVVDFSRNNISCIEGDTFYGAPFMVYINLGRNTLSYLPENVFQYTTDLYYLLLNANSLETIDNRVFRDLHRLIQLSLFDNSIVSMMEGALDGTTSLFYLQWNYDTPDFSFENRLICDCSSRWLYHYILEKGRNIQTALYCASPPDLRGRDISSLSKEDFGCIELSEASLQIKVEPSCDRLVVRKGGCLRVSCTSTPSSRTSWNRLGQSSIQVAAHTCRSYSPCVAQRGVSELVISDASEEDVGNYICTATLKNVTTAVTCQVLLGEPPTVSLRPTDQYLGWPGEAAYFRVQVSGQPHPTVEWHHDSPLGYTELIEEDKRHVISTAGSLVILDTTLEDAGEYRAVVSNGAGSITLTAFLEYFFSTPCRQRCQNGGTCYQTHYCYCQSGFHGRHCESGEGSLLSPPPTSTSGSGSGYSGYDDTEPGDDQYSDLESGDSEYESGYSDDNSVNSEEDSVISDDNSVISSGELPILSPSFGGTNDTTTENGETVQRKRRQSNDVTDKKSFPWILAGASRQQTQGTERRWQSERKPTVNGQRAEIKGEEKGFVKTEREQADTVAGSNAEKKRESYGFGVWRHFNNEGVGGKTEKMLRIDAEIDKAVEEMIGEEEAMVSKDALLPDAGLVEGGEERGEGDEGEGRRERETAERWEEVESEDFTREIISETELYPESEWNEDQRNMFLELGLAVEWNGDTPPVEQNGDREHTTSSPVFMGLKLLPADDNFKSRKTHAAHDIHQDK